MTAIRRSSMGIAGALALALAAGGESIDRTAPDRGSRPDEPLRKWLVLRPIPVSSGLLGRLFPPGEETQRRLFGKDLLEAAGGESGVQPRAGAKVAIAGRNDYGMGVLTVTREGSRVFAQLSGQPRYEIFPRSEDTFFWKVVEAEVTFVKDKDGKVSEAVHRQGGQTIHAPRMEELKVAQVDPKVFDVYVGRYDYGGGKAIMTIAREGDRLFAQLTGQPRFEIFPSSETEFFWKAVNAQVEFIKDDAGKVIKAIHRQGGQKIEAPRLEGDVPGANGALESERRRL